MMPLLHRVFPITLPVSGAALAGHAQAQLLLDEKDPQAVAPGYVADAGHVDAWRFPKFTAGQDCARAALHRGKAGDSTGGCPLFASRQVAAAGWCSAWAEQR